MRVQSTGREATTPPQLIDTILRALLVGFALLISIPLVSLAADGGWPPERTVPVLFLLVAMLTVLMRWPAAVPLLATLAALAVSIPAGADPPTPAPKMLLGVVGFLIVLRFRSRSAIPITAAVMLAYVGYTVLVGPSSAVWASLDDAVLVAVLTLTGTVFVGVLVDNSESMQHLRNERLSAELSTSFDDSLATVAASTRRLLHDEVIGTLTAIADHRAPAHACTPCSSDARLRRDCALVADALASARLTSTRVAGPLGQLVSDVGGHGPVEVALGGGPRVHLDAEQADAVGRALAEALRNVARHAGAAVATISWRIEDAEVQLQVVDDGPGRLLVIEHPYVCAACFVRIRSSGLGSRVARHHRRASHLGTDQQRWHLAHHDVAVDSGAGSAQPRYNPSVGPPGDTAGHCRSAVTGDARNRACARRQWLACSSLHMG